MSLVAMKALLIFDLTTGTPVVLPNPPLMVEVKEPTREEQDHYSKYDHIDIRELMDDDDDELIQFINNSIAQQTNSYLQE